MTTFEELLKTTVEGGYLAGAVALAKSRDGKFSYAHAYGNRTLNPASSSAAMDLDTVFPVASMTKLMTTIAVLQLVSRGVVTLDEDISHLVPDIASQGIIVPGSSPDPSGAIHTVPRQNPLTLRLLLTHSAGMEYDFFNPVIAQILNARGRPVMSGSTVTERFGLPLVYEPGTNWAYSPGIDFAGKAVEALTGKPLESYMFENIWVPLGIEDSVSFFPQDKPTMKGRIAETALRDPTTGKVVHYGGPSINEGAVEAFGGQGVNASLPAYLEVLSSLLLDDERLLPKSVTAQMFTPQLGPQSKAVLIKKMEKTDWIIGPFPQTAEYDWGLGGILIDGDKHEYRKKGTLIWSGMLNLFWFIDRGTGLCGVFGTSLMPPNDDMTRNLMEAWEKEMYQRVAE